MTRITLHHSDSLDTTLDRIPIYLPSNQDNKKHPIITRTSIQHVFVKYSLLIKPNTCYCKDHPLQTRNVTSQDDLSNKMPKNETDDTSKLKSDHQSFLEMRIQLISQAVDLEMKSATLDEPKCKTSFEALDGGRGLT